MALVALTAQAKVSLPNIFGDNMVLQRNTEVKIWGTAEAGKTVVISPSWDKTTVKVKADADGKWSASVRTGEAGGPYEITISDGEKLVLGNVLLGEVWLCSGQSNMEMPMKGYNNQPVENSIEYIIKAKPATPIRMCNVTKTAEFTPQNDVQVSWKEHTPEAVADISATAYFFAEYLQKIINVPVGIIVSSWGGSSIEAWMDKETLSAFPDVKMPATDKKEDIKRPHQTPTMLYNGMLAPIMPYTIKGMIWYQGCSNRGRAQAYRKLQPAFVSMLREQWGCGEFPFYYVQIAPYGYEGADGTGAAYLREAQMMNVAEIPNSGMAVTMDIGNAGCIHPAQKLEVGHRLAYMALADNYGVQGFDSRSPIYKSVEFNGNEAIITFEAGEKGIAPLGKELVGFEVAGSDKVFHKASAKIISRFQVKVTCEEVPEPAAVRYAFRNVPAVSLTGRFDLPASPFRTDNW